MRELARRKQNRLENYDYKEKGTYFVTICTKDKKNLFWSPFVTARVGEAISLPLNDNIFSETGMAVKRTIEDIPNHYIGVYLLTYVIMPNHVHLVLLFSEDKENSKDSVALSTVIVQMKRQASRLCRESIWQRSFHDHIIRDTQDYLRISRYIYENPVNWKKDCYFTE